MSYCYNILAKLRFWDSTPVAFPALPPRFPRDGVLLCQRKNPLTKQEIQLQRLIESNDGNLSQLDARHLFRLQLFDDPAPVAGPATSHARLLARLTAPSLTQLAKFRYLVAINPRTGLLPALRSLSTNGVAIAIFTGDYDAAVLSEQHDDVDAIIGPKLSGVVARPREVRRFAVATTPAEAFARLSELLIELAPKPFSTLAPIMGEPSSWPSLDIRAAHDADFIITLPVKEEEAPICTESFAQFVNDLAPLVSSVLATELQIFKYRSLIDSLPEALPALIRLAALDGARFEIRYADGSPSL